MPAARQEAQATLASLVRGGSFEPRRAQRLTKDGATVDVSVVASGLVNGAGRTYAVSMTERLLQRGTP